LIELAEIYSKNWLACDGLWFQAVEWHPCKAIGKIEYAEFAKVIDDRISCRCISCYPDITESEREGCCAWEFILEETDAG